MLDAYVQSLFWPDITIPFISVQAIVGHTLYAISLATFAGSVVSLTSGTALFRIIIGFIAFFFHLQLSFVLPAMANVLSPTGVIVTGWMLAIPVAVAAFLGKRKSQDSSPQLLDLALFVAFAAMLLNATRYGAARLAYHDGMGDWETPMYHFPIIAQMVKEGSFWAPIGWYEHFFFGHEMTIGALSIFLRSIAPMMVINFLYLIMLSAIILMLLSMVVGQIKGGGFLKIAAAIVLYVLLEIQAISHPFSKNDYSVSVLVLASVALMMVSMLRQNDNAHNTDWITPALISLLSAGMALGMKPTSAAVIMIPLFLLISMVRARQHRISPLRGIWILGLGAVLMSAPLAIWFVRNFVVIGHPLDPDWGTGWWQTYRLLLALVTPDETATDLLGAGILRHTYPDKVDIMGHYTFQWLTSLLLYAAGMALFIFAWRRGLKKTSLFLPTLLLIFVVTAAFVVDHFFIPGGAFVTPGKAFYISHERDISRFVALPQVRYFLFFLITSAILPVLVLAWMGSQRLGSWGGMSDIIDNFEASPGARQAVFTIQRHLPLLFFAGALAFALAIIPYARWWEANSQRGLHLVAERNQVINNLVSSWIEPERVGIVGEIGTGLFYGRGWRNALIPVHAFGHRRGKGDDIEAAILDAGRDKNLTIIAVGQYWAELGANNKYGKAYLEAADWLESQPWVERIHRDAVFAIFRVKGKPPE